VSQIRIIDPACTQIEANQVSQICKRGAGLPIESWFRWLVIGSPKIHTSDFLNIFRAKMAHHALLPKAARLARYKIAVVIDFVVKAHAAAGPGDCLNGTALRPRPIGLPGEPAGHDRDQ
jgi:hypothetical protein